MSLVAYNASDESDGDESDGENVLATTKLAAVNSSHNLGHISDEDEYDAVSSTSVSTSLAITHFVESQCRLTGASSEIDSTSVRSLEDLPVPRSNARAVMPEEDELEDEVKPKSAEIENAQKPPAKKRQPVKITIPSLENTQLDEDTDAKKKPTPSTTKSGLFSLLPPPMHSAKKEINRPLIPHTLTKKPQPVAKGPDKSSAQSVAQKPSVSSSSSKDSSTTAAPNKKVALNIAMYGSDSDDNDDEAGASNFFSLNSSSKPSSSSKDTSQLDTSKRLQSGEVSSSEVNAKSVLTGADSAMRDLVDKETESGKEEAEDAESNMNSGPEPGAVNNAPLQFNYANSSSSRGWSTSSSFSQSYLGAVGLAGPIAPTNSFISQGSYMAAPVSAQYNMANAEVDDSNVDDQTVTDDDLKQFMSDKEFQRFSGKRKRGLEEAINIVDANVDDYVDPSEVSKYLTEETEYVSQKNKDNMPTAQQRRKKQITYLAYQAKERELELKNTWAQSRMTKKQTQSKYGF